MKVCAYKGLLIAVLTRNEHCPPHVHVGSDKWEARFEFSFWHNGVRLYDVMPAQKQPTVEVLEELRQELKLPIHLRRAREIWWSSSQTVCLVNQLWDVDAGEVVSAKDRRPEAKVVESAHFDSKAYKIVLRLAGQSGLLEIAL
jgi:hypothetical protein